MLEIGYIYIGLFCLFIGVFIPATAWFVDITTRKPPCPCCEGELHLAHSTWACARCGYMF